MSGLQRINWTQIDSANVPSGYTVDIGNNNNPINQIYANDYYSGNTSLNDLFLNEGILDNGILTLKSLSGNTITISGFSGSDQYITGGTYNNGELTLYSNSGNTITITGFYTGTTDNDTYVTGGTYSNNTLTLLTNSGNTITVTGFTSDNIYNSNGELSGTRIVAQGSNDLTFSGTGRFMIGNIDNPYSLGKMFIGYQPNQSFGLSVAPNGLKSGVNTAYDSALNLSLDGVSRRSIVSTMFGNHIGGISNIHIKDRTAYDKFLLNTDNTNSQTDDIVGRYAFFTKVFSNPTHLGTLAEVARLDSLIDSVNVTGLTAGGRLVFYTNSGLGGGVVERMRITPNGNILIGTTTGSTKLVVSDTNDPVTFKGIQSANDSDILTIDTNGILHKYPISGLTDNNTYITGGTYSSGTIVLRSNSGTTVSITDLFTGYTYPLITGTSQSGNTLTIKKNDGSTEMYNPNVIVPSGTTTQFVKGDGSFDSTTETKINKAVVMTNLFSYYNFY